MAQVSWDDEKIGNKVRQLKFKKDTWTRFCLLDQNAEYEPMHYGPRYNLCTKHGGRKEQFCTKCGTKVVEQQDATGIKMLMCPSCNLFNPQVIARCTWCDSLKKEYEQRFASNVVVYRTDEQGNPLGPLNDRSFYITFWIFGPDHFGNIRQMKKNYGDLRKHDLLFFCKEDRFQNGTLQICPDAWWTANKDFQAMVVAAFKEQRTQNLSDKIGRLVPYEAQAFYIANDGQMPRAQQKPNQQGQNGQQGGPQQVRPQFDPAAVQQRVSQMPTFGGFGTQTPSPPAMEVDPEMDSLLSGGPAPAQPVIAPVKPADPPSNPTTPPPAEGAPAAAGGFEDLDQMLNDL